MVECGIANQRLGAICKVCGTRETVKSLIGLIQFVDKNFTLFFMFPQVTLPGSKSLSNRAIILAALSDESTVLKNVLGSEDVDYLRHAMAKLNVMWTT